MGNDALKAAQADCLPDNPEPYCTLQEAAHELGVSVADLQRALDANQIACVHQFSRRLIARTDLDAYRTQNAPTNPLPGK